MSEPYAVCGCGIEIAPETSAQRHAAVCSKLGWPWTNPAWPRPDGDAA